VKVMQSPELDRRYVISKLGRLLRRVETTDGDDPCWLWLGGLTSDGYPSMLLGGRPLRGHRLLAFVRHGDLSRLVAHHACRNRRCLRPAHLIAMTAAEHNRLHAELRRAEVRRAA
jgi:hypothetical protein